jgi:2-polyprenyl-6-methoxyphenol hydroxylase-like FAD-dependent oxidoreductase
VTPPARAARVVIVGAGPVGLLLACELGRAGVAAIVVDRLASPMQESRASQITALTAELLHERGFDQLLAEAAHEPRAHFAGFGFDLAGLDSAYAGNWKVPQYRTEAFLAERAAGLGATILRAHELTSLAERAGHVRCEVRGPDGDAAIEAGYVVGCDGAASTVRRLHGFPVSVTAPTRELLRADVTGLSIRDRRFERLAGGFAVASTRDGVTRVMVHAAGQEPAPRAGPPEFGEVAAAWAAVTGEDITGGTPAWLDAFDNARGLAGAYRRGRVLLAGDAAHWHMPIGGQALNVGLQDAVNLGWKLAAESAGRAAPGLLDTYHAERHAAAARVLDYVAAQDDLMLGGPEAEPLRAVMRELAALGPVREHLALVASNLGDRYEAAAPPPAGQRLRRLGLRTAPGGQPGGLPAAPVNPVVVRLTPAAAGPGRAAISTIHAIDQDGSFPGVTALLVRPDGYVAWAGDSEDGLDQAIGKLLRTEGRKESARV